MECIPIDGRDNLFLLPSHVGLAECEVTLGLAQELSGTIQTLKNLPGAITYLWLFGNCGSSLLVMVR
ncbi:regulatory protein CII [Microcystis panniformis FACHB-1757]|uniref:Regulatory protein CII n=1 Tax=Microcystis panniformis FACHB-1757 TaxID=1638788 RepID=A0A0K1S6A4_9CHRO|nr:hypothetical protein [Microcystis panniformis]AKV69649.1 regulatory protein CII [Microcystis panniformis FACHB-1757]